MEQTENLDSKKSQAPLKDPFKNSRKLFEQAEDLMPGGVNSPVRAFQSVNTPAIFIESGKGSRIWDADNNCYIDYCLSWGPLILGHAREDILDRIRIVAKNGTSFGACNSWEVKLAKEVRDAIPSMEKVRFVSSGTEAVMSALRLARAYTKREKIIKFDGGYHGHMDSCLVKAGSGLKTFGNPSSPGVPEAAASNTIVLNFNDQIGFEKAMREHGEEVAAVIIEPLPANFGLIELKSSFLKSLRTETEKSGSLLIFDEVISGFRVRMGSYGDEIGITPDLTTLGKVIGGGLPVGAYGGKKEIMEMIAPEGPVYQAGTLSGNPLAMAAGYETLQSLKALAPHERMIDLARELASGIFEICKKHNVPCRVTQAGSILWPWFSEKSHLDPSMESEFFPVERFKLIHQELLSQGVYWPPSAWEVLFLSTEHTQVEIQATLEAFDRALSKVDFSQLQKTC